MFYSVTRSLVHVTSSQFYVTNVLADVTFMPSNPFKAVFSKQKKGDDVTCMKDELIDKISFGYKKYNDRSEEDSLSYQGIK